MAWAITQTVKKYYPEDDRDRAETDQFTNWIYAKKEAAEAALTKLGEGFAMSETEREAWS
jgi:hypothetical protein